MCNPEAAMSSSSLPMCRCRYVFNNICTDVLYNIVYVSQPALFQMHRSSLDMWYCNSNHFHLDIKQAKSGEFKAEFQNKHFLSRFDCTCFGYITNHAEYHCSPNESEYLQMIYALLFNYVQYGWSRHERQHSDYFWFARCEMWLRCVWLSQSTGI